MMAADVSSVARLLRGEAGKKGGPEIVTMDLLGGCGGGAAPEDEVVDLEVTVPAGWERRLDLLSGKTFLTPRHPSVQGGHQDLNLPPPAAPTTNSTAVCTLDMVRSALERAAAGRTTASPATSSTSSASTSSSSSAGKRNRSPQPAMRAAACPSCLTYVLIAEEDPRCPRCAAMVPPLRGKKSAAAEGSGKKPRIDLNAAADETE
ncbi:protein GL2-INTERACTING REPRESSOR 1-like [Miscanthus floridulus]|uniref:protein GL2-INTERACTING REPRESSOR 1-like n=1 Tax=Miscanthus floridulus TaxID=154761 RepID=UPI00345A1954